MLQEAIKVTYEGLHLKGDASPGWPSWWAVPRICCGLLVQLGAVEYESHTKGHGLESFLKSQSLRQELIDDFEESYDEEQLILCQSNIGNSLMAENRVEEAVQISRSVYHKAKEAGGMRGAYAYFPLNFGVALQAAKLYDEARLKIEEAIPYVRDSWGGEGGEMAL